MLAAMIFLGWCLVVTSACAVGFHKELSAAKVDAEKLRVVLAQARADSEHARQKAAMLLQYVDTDREYQRFDEVLKALPVRSGFVGYPRIFEIMEAERFDFVAHHACSEKISDSLTVTKLAFEPIHLHMFGTDHTGWRRNGWVMVPESAFQR
jgi:hypothetical protein